MATLDDFENAKYLCDKFLRGQLAGSENWDIHWARWVVRFSAYYLLLRHKDENRHGGNEKFTFCHACGVQYGVCGHCKTCGEIDINCECEPAESEC